jgi:hypothetical protein
VVKKAEKKISFFQIKKKSPQNLQNCSDYSTFSLSGKPSEENNFPAINRP